MELVKLKCESCGATVKVNKELKKATCNYCGSEFLVNDEVKRNEINKNIIYTDEAKIRESERKVKELEYKDKDKKRGIITWFAGFCSLVLLYVLLFSLLLPSKNEVCVPLDAKKYKGENYEFVVQQLEDAGFKNIESKPIQDLVTGWITKDGEVESVSIAGDTEFEEGEIFSKDSQVIVIYHTF